MSQEVLEILAQVADAFERRDVEAFVAICDPEVEFVDFLMEMEGGGSFHGHEGVRSWWESYFTVFGDVSQEIEEVRDLGDWVLVHGRTRGRVHRDRVKVSWRSFRSEAEALEAAERR